MNSLNIVLLMAGGAEGGSPLPTFIFMGAIFLVMYFFMIRPQTKKANEQKKFLENMKKGDRVVNVSGFHGKIISIDNGTVMLELDSNVKVKMEKAGISMDYTLAAYGKDEKPAEKVKETN
jgi:preprotein translocase subunit YajC